MKVTVKENVLTINTGIAATAAAKKRVVTDEKGTTQLYILVNSQGATPTLDVKGITCNSIVDGNLALQMLLPAGRDEKYVRNEYGSALIAAKKFIGKIAAEIKAENDALDGIMAEVEQQ